MSLAGDEITYRTLPTAGFLRPPPLIIPELLRTLFCRETNAK